MSVGNITSLVLAVAALAGTIPAIILALKGKSKADAVSTTVAKEVTRANKQDDALLELQQKVNGGGNVDLPKLP